MARLIVLCVLIFSGVGSAQSEMEEMSASGLLSQATRMLGSDQYSGAIPYLKLYLERMVGVDDDRVLGLTQKVRLKLGKLMAWLEDPQTSVTYLEEYTENLPFYRPQEAYKLLAANLYKLENYEGAIDAVKIALSRPEPQGLKARKKKKIDLDTMSDTQLGGFSARQIRRIEKEASEEGGDLAEGFSDEKPEEEEDLTLAEVVLLQMTLAESYAKLAMWDESVAPYKFVIENTLEDDRKGFAVMQLVNALVSLERFDEASDFIMKLAATDSRYDIRVNMAMMTAASALLDAEEFDSALMLYRMVLPRQNLMDYQADLMNQIRRDAGIPEMVITLVTNETGRVESMYGKKYGDMNAAGSDSNTPAPPKPDELIELEEKVGMLLSLPPYENEVLYRTGLIYGGAGRPWQAVSALDLLAEMDETGPLGQRAFAESMMILVDPLQKYAEVEERGYAYLENHIEGIGPRMVAHALTLSYQKQVQWANVKKLRPILDNFVYSEEASIRQYECELYYLQAIADMILLDYKGSKIGFEKILTDYSGLQHQENATYWHAMSSLFLKEHQEALDEFDSYAEKWPSGSWIPSVVFHSGISLFGLEKLPEAQERFTEVIEQYPDSTIYADACSLRGDLYAADGKLDEAQADYEEAIAKALQPRQGTYATFQMVSMFEMEERYDEIIAAVDAYLARYHDDADVAKAAYWVGKTKLAQGLVDEAIDAYRDTIIAYGDDILQSGVDLIISELAVLHRRLSDEQRETLVASLEAATVEHAEEATLQLRLRVLLAEMNGTTEALGRELIAELEDLSIAPPPVLGALCDASLAIEDYSRAEELLMIFETRYEDSEYLRAALKLRGFELFELGKYDEALKIANEAQAIYGTDVYVVWAQLLRGRMALIQGDYDAALKLFRAVLSVPQWRGDAFAEATCYLGKVEEAAGNLRDAFAWYQRAYFQYRGMAGGTWAADGYLGSARCLEGLGLELDRLNTYRAMLFDRYVNTLPQADVAREALGSDMVLEISTLLEQGFRTNITVNISAEAP